MLAAGCAPELVWMQWLKEKSQITNDKELKWLF
jgi:hypothetical protein